MTSSLASSFDEGLAVLTLTQGERGNPLDRALINELKERVLWLWQCEGLRCVLLRAEGRDFSFGGDLRVRGLNLDLVGTAPVRLKLVLLWA